MIAACGGSASGGRLLNLPTCTPAQPAHLHTCSTCPQLGGTKMNKFDSFRAYRR